MRKPSSYQSTLFKFGGSSWTWSHLLCHTALLGTIYPRRRGRRGLQILWERIHSCPFQFGEKKKAFSRLWLQEEKWHCLPWKLFLYFCVSKTLSQCLHFPNYHTMFALISATEDDYSIHVHMIHNNNLGLYSSKPTLHFTCFLCAQTLCVYLFHLSCVHECRQNIVLRLSCLGLWSDSLDRCTLDKSLVTWVWSSKPA